MQRLGLADVLGDKGRVFADVAIAGGADVGICFIGFLHHRAEETGELRQRPLQNAFAKVDIAEDALARIGKPAKRRCGKQCLGARGEMRGGGDGARLLAGEVMEEPALGEPGPRADVVDAGR